MYCNSLFFVQTGVDRYIDPNDMEFEDGGDDDNTGHHGMENAFVAEYFINFIRRQIFSILLLQYLSAIFVGQGKKRTIN